MDGFLQLLMCVFLPLAGGGGVFVMVKLANWVTGPVYQSARERRFPIQFTIVDFLCLFVVMQAPMALIHSVHDLPEGARWTADIFLWVFGGLLWFTGVENLSRAGVRRPWPRIIYLMAVLPFAVLGSVAAPLCAVAVVGTFVVGISQGRIEGAILSAFVLASILLPLGLYGAARYTRWMVAGSRAGPAEE